MKTRKYNHLRATVKNLRRELHEAREVINYQQHVTADLRKQINDINAAKESELDTAILRVHDLAIVMEEMARKELERAKAYCDGTPRI